MDYYPPDKVRNCSAESLDDGGCNGVTAETCLLEVLAFIELLYLILSCGTGNNSELHISDSCTKLELG